MPDVDMLLESYGDEPTSHYAGPSEEQEFDHALCMAEDALATLNYPALWGEAHRLYLEHQIAGGTRSLCEIMGSLIAKRTLLAYMERQFRWQLESGHRLQKAFRAKLDAAFIARADLQSATPPLEAVGSSGMTADKEDAE